MSKFIQYLAARLRWIKLTNWRNHLKNYQCVIQYFCSIPASLVTKYNFHHIETWSSTQKSVNECKFKKIYHFTWQADILFLYDQCFFQAGRHATREKNLCEQPFAFPMSIKTNAKCNHSTTLRQRECKTKNKKNTHTHHQQKPKQQQQQKQTEKIRLISKTTISLVYKTFFVHFIAVLHAVTTSWKRLISRFGGA